MSAFKLAIDMCTILARSPGLSSADQSGSRAQLIGFCDRCFDQMEKNRPEAAEDTPFGGEDDEVG